MIKPVIYASLFSLSLLVSSPVFAAPTECTEKLPKGLDKEIAERFPGYRAPTLADLDKENIEMSMRFGGDGCFVIAEGDFDGNRENDITMMLTPIKGIEGRLIVALQKNKAWQFSELESFCEVLGNCYVDSIEPGIYERTSAAEGAITEKNEREKIKSKNTSIMTGIMESTGVVYVYSNDGWHYVLVSN